MVSGRDGDQLVTEHQKRVLEMARLVHTSLPGLPMHLVFTVCAAIRNQDAGSDALLCLSDALDEAAGLADLRSEVPIGRQLRLLAELPREMAPKRAAVGSSDVG